MKQERDNRLSIPHASMTPHEQIGPILFSRGLVEDRHALSAIVFLPVGVEPPSLTARSGGPVERVLADTLCGYDAWRFDFELTPEDEGYQLGDDLHCVETDFSGDLNIGYVSCNGKEHGDFDRDLKDRNVMWRRLLDEHRHRPLHLLLHGGDQIYADVALESHPELHAWREMSHEKADQDQPTEEMEAAALQTFFDIWCRVITAPGTVELSAEVPSIMMWDDHDIVDGWGSRPAPFQEGPVGQMLFRVAARIFRLFQTGGVVDETAGTFSAAYDFNDFGIVVPDLRSERERQQVMGEPGWKAFSAALQDAPPDRRLFVLSSVPPIGPRLSLVEDLFRFIPGMQKYEDDLRDQWQSHAHREEWTRFLRALAERMEAGAPVTVLSGEIHLAGRGEMTLRDGRVLHQLIASGISHPAPPRGYARTLSAFATWGDAPVPDRPIAMRRIPDLDRVYIDQRNFLIIRRENNRWTAVWELEETGRTVPLAL